MSTATEDAVATPTKTPITFNVITDDNGAGLDSDPDLGDVLTLISIDDSATKGTVTLDADDGTVTFTPKGGASGTDSFMYTISDGNGGTSTATVTITIG